MFFKDYFLSLWHINFNMGSISYTGVILDDISREKLRREFNSWSGAFPDGWVWIAHHMTIKFGAPLPEEKRKELLGKPVTLKVTKLANDNMCMAIGVTGAYCENKIPHVTLAVNKAGGGKPQMSNNLTDWVPYTVDFDLTGTIQEVQNTMQEVKKNINEITNLNDLPFIGDIKAVNGKIYQVGGAVRDQFLNKVSKDLDIVIAGVPADKLQAILTKYGKVDMVGASFGVIKFKEFGSSEDIDIAIPRTEKKNSQGGYQGFDVNADHTLPIEKDLERRDFTINSIAKDLDGNVIDPFGGAADLRNKIIKVTNPIAFTEDPLRMLRAVQFASRFGFTIEPNTFKMIQQNAHTIKEISKERILIEFDKIVMKGDVTIGAQLLVNSGLFDHIFGNKFIGSYKPFKFVKKMSEFIFWLIQGFTNKPEDYFKNVMKGDIKNTAEIKALNLSNTRIPTNKLEGRWLIFDLNRIAPSILDSYFIVNELDEYLPDFKSNAYPISYKEMQINGNDLLTMGFKDQQIGVLLKKALNGIYADQVDNNNQNLTNYIKNGG